jgi:hypothetical protein
MGLSRAMLWPWRNRLMESSVCQAVVLERRGKVKIRPAFTLLRRGSLRFLLGPISERDVSSQLPGLEL